MELKQITPTQKDDVPTTYTPDQAFLASVKYFKGDDLAARVWVNKYALKDSYGNIFELTPDDLHRRLAKEIARIEKMYPNPLTEDELFELFRDFKYIVPQGGPMTGIGNDFQVGSLSNCFVVGNGADSYGGIIMIDQEQVQLMKRRGGVGHDLSHIRPKGSPVKNSALTSTGIVPFMERFSNSTREVAQDGRRGALMLSVSIKHPDSEDFIDAKMDEGKVTGANVSVKIDDEFMQAVRSKTTYHQKYPIESTDPIYTKDIEAVKLWEKIVFNAWKSAEPGILFWDTIIRESVPDCYSDLGYKTVSTNPCGEIPLCPYDSCRLIALNLYSYVDEPFTNLLTQGMVIKDGSKMSKSKGNVVDPNDLIQEYGADTVRLFSLFAAPPERDLEWSAQGVEGSSRFLNRVYRLIMQNKEQFLCPSPFPAEFNEPGKTLHRKIHQTIRRVTESIEQNFHFNTAISAMMELFNVLLTTTGENSSEKADPPVVREAVSVLLLLLSPMVPHFAAEMWEQIGKKDSIENQPWPKFDADAAKEDLLTIVLQVNGKVRSRLLVSDGMSDEALVQLALADDNMVKFIEGKAPKKTIVVKKKLVNIVV